MDTKFSVAVHILILISEAPNPLNSDQIAGSVGTNASYIRKILSLLKKSGMIDSHRGVSGYVLTNTPDQITLLRIYQAVMNEPQIHLLDIHQNPNDACIVGHNIRPVLGNMFRQTEEDVEEKLRKISLTDCIENMRMYINENQEKEEEMK